MNTFSIQRPRPSMEMRTPACCRTPVNRGEVNDYLGPCWRSQVSRTGPRPPPAPRCRTPRPWCSIPARTAPCASPPQPFTRLRRVNLGLLRPVHHRHEVENAAAQGYVGQIRAPGLVRAVHHKVAQQVWKDPVLRVRHRRPRPLVDRRQTHLGHRRPAHHLGDVHALLPVDLPRRTVQRRAGRQQGAERGAVGDHPRRWWA